MMLGIYSRRVVIDDDIQNALILLNNHTGLIDDIIISSSSSSSSLQKLVDEAQSKHGYGDGDGVVMDNITDYGDLVIMPGLVDSHGKRHLCGSPKSH